MGSSGEHMNKPTTETRELSEPSNPIKRYIGRAGQLRYKVAPWMMDRQVAHIPVGLAISWLVFLWPLDVAASVLWGARLTAVMLFFGFILYEVTEDEEINDQAYRDIQGFVIGLGLGAIAQVLLAVFVGLLVSGEAA